MFVIGFYAVFFDFLLVICRGAKGFFWGVFDGFCFYKVYFLLLGPY